MTSEIGRGPAGLVANESIGRTAGGDGVADPVDLESSVLTDWMTNPDGVRGIAVLASDWQWNKVTYQQLADDALRVAAGLQRQGVDSSSVVAICQPDLAQFVTQLFGVLAAGATVAPLAPALMFRDRDDYVNHMADLLQATRPEVILVSDDDRFSEGLELQTEVITTSRLCADVVNPMDGPAEINSVPLLQFTSGSSGRARGVKISHQALAANLDSIKSWLELHEGTRGASWLPTHHDMGLVGCLISAVTVGCNLDLMSPAQFIRSPRSFLRCFDNGAEYTAMPNFGLDYIVRRVKPEDVAGMDLSHVRAVVVGAERVNASSVQQFTDLLAPAGFSPDAVCPAYGLAEATLAVTGKRLGTETVTDESIEGTLSICVSCGPPLAGVRVSVVTDEDEPAGECEVGEIVVESDSLFSGYVAAASIGSRARFRDRRLYTGDAGYLRDGELFLIGRMGDAIKVRGVSLFAEDLEQSLVAAGFSSGERLAALLGNAADGASHVVVVTDDRTVVDRTEWRDVLVHLPDVARLQVIIVSRQGILRTSSGKPRRRVMWQQYQDGLLSFKQDITDSVFESSGVRSSRDGSVRTRWRPPK